MFAVTWDDVQRWCGNDVKADPVWPPYQENAKRAGRQLYQQIGGTDPDDLNTYVWTNPIDTLLAYLANPDADVWRRRAVGALAGMLTRPATKTTAASHNVGAAISAALYGAALPTATTGGITVVRAPDTNGCPLTLIVDARDARQPTWSALAVIDDRPESVRDDDPDHQRRWAAWLYWGNLVQFLDAAGGDGAQLALSTVDTLEPAELAVSEGTGLVLARRAQDLDAETATWLGLVREAEPEPEVADTGVVDKSEADERWSEVLSLLFPGESALESLVRAMIAHGIPLPEQGYELGDAGWQAELAWPSRRIAVLLGDAFDQEAEDRDRAYAAAGWDARTARQWSIDELVEKITASAETSGASR
ncbi:hypothetical protein [Virgisporangium aurantiacum]|uniref:hypothetical protein n=1 Tax=Virgisporangium aurantiacum TaxID=175570 RepID=UPI0019504CC5|nr:hypothetical protein [Virgisporangium aurantiacum]